MSFGHPGFPGPIFGQKKKKKVFPPPLTRLLTTTRRKHATEGGGGAHHHYKFMVGSQPSFEQLSGITPHQWWFPTPLPMPTTLIKSSTSLCLPACQPHPLLSL